MNEKCIMPEMPYCPCCEHGLIIYPEDVNSIEGCDTQWVCLLKDKNERVSMLHERANCKK